MTRVGAGIFLGAFGAVVSIGACALDESGTLSDGGSTIDVTNDVQIDGGADGQDATQDVTYDVPDLGTGETEAGVPCTCVTSVPSGYTIVEYVKDQRVACSAGIYGTQQDLVEGPTAGASTCSCTCATTPTTAPSCSCGSNPAAFDISSGNGNCTDVTGQTLMAATNCYKTAQSLNPNGNKLNDMLAGPATACTPSGGACGNPTKVQTIPPVNVNSGRACNLTASTSTCGSGGTCIPTPGSPYGLCVTNFTSAPCGGDFPVTHAVGGSVNDTRTCGPGTCTSCSLSTGTCGTPQLTLYVGDNSCGNNGTAIPLPADNSTCTPTNLGNSATFDSAKYSVSSSGASCAYTNTFVAQGTLGVKGPFNICCHP